jgi:hypothetical protein
VLFFIQPIGSHTIDKDIGLRHLLSTCASSYTCCVCVKNAFVCNVTGLEPVNSDDDLQSSDNDDDEATIGDDNTQVDEAASIVAFATQRWENRSFIYPMQLLSQLSGYQNLLMLYTILCCLPVSSASAERALSKLKIVKNRLRTSLSDDTMSSLLILASEKDILMEISSEEIINRMAIASPSLKSLLLF